MRYLSLLLLISTLAIVAATKASYYSKDFATVEVEVRGGASPLSEASVILDLNNNGVWDEHLGEPRGWTDGNGIVVFSNITSVDDSGDGYGVDWQPSRIMMGNLRGAVGARDVQVDFVLPAGTSTASLGLYDLRGRRLAQTHGTGNLELTVPSGLPAGVYFLRLSAGSATPVSQKITSAGARTRAIRAYRVSASDAMAAGWSQIGEPTPKREPTDRGIIGLLVDHADYPATVQQETIEPGFNSFSVYMGPDLHEDVVVSDDIGLVYISQTEDSLTFTFEGEAPDIRVGDILIGTEDDGYIRRVVSVEIERGWLTVITEMVSPWEVIRNIEVNETFGFDDPPIDFPFSDVILLDETFEGDHGTVQASAGISSGRLVYSPSLEFGFRIENYQFTSYKTIFHGQLDFDADVYITTTGVVDYSPDPVTLFSVTKTQWIPKTPLFLKTTFQVEAGCSLDIDGELAATFGLESQTGSSAGASYAHGDWQHVFTIEPVGNVGVVPSADNQVAGGARVYVRPKVNTTIVPMPSSTGPSLSLEPYARLNGEIAAGGWCADLYLGYGVFLGFSGDFFGLPFFNYSRTLLSDEYQLVDGCDDVPAPPTGFVYIPPGTFTMGSPADEPGRHSDETQNQVTLTHDFFIQSTEVTNQQYMELAQWAYDHSYVTVSSTSLLDNLDGSTEELLQYLDGNCEITFSGGAFSVDAGKGDHPVLGVTWYGSVAYCDWLSLQQGLPRAYNHSTWQCNGGNTYTAAGYRLPTEAEWEYACRAGSTTAFASGPIVRPIYCSPLDPNLDAMGWYCGNAGGWTHPVAQKMPNAWGLYDMHGNVWEWCNDWYGAYDGTVTDPSGPVTGTHRVFRGGAWDVFAFPCRSAFRCFEYPYYSPLDFSLGFRPVRSVP